MRKRRITAAEFDALRPLLNISDERITAARAVLVDGVTYQVAADQFGWKRQATGNAVNAVLRILQRYNESQKATANAEILLPDGWERVTLIAPSYLIPKFRGEIAEATPQPMQKTKAVKKPKNET
ncbi:MAG: TrfB-related DNA-binding protein [Methylobacter sp.]|nr:TrfB-related DNA-binding protein [Methylobacter sp.]